MRSDLQKYSKNFVFSSRDPDTDESLLYLLENIRKDYIGLKNTHLYEFTYLNKRLEKENLSDDSISTFSREDDFNDLADIKTISFLYISFYDPGFIERLKEFVNLKILILRYKGAAELDIDFLENLGSITYLDFNSIQAIKDYSSLSKLQLLESLKLSNNEALPMLELQFSCLKSLDISNNNLQDDQLEAILKASLNEAISLLETLDLRNNNLSNPSTLVCFRNLKKLNLENNVIRNISFVKELEQLEHLDLNRNKVSKGIKKLKKLKHLSTLNISNNSNIDESIFEVIDRDTITKLNISNNRISECRGICSYKSMKSLDISNNLIKDLDISDLQNLEKINVSDNRLECLILNGKGLVKINASNNNIRSLEMGDGMKKITTIDLRNNNLQHFILRGDVSLSSAILNFNHNCLSELPLDSFEKMKDITNVNLYYEDEEEKNKPPYGLNIANNPIMEPPLKTFIEGGLDEWIKIRREEKIAKNFNNEQ